MFLSVFDIVDRNIATAPDPEAEGRYWPEGVHRSISMSSGRATGHSPLDMGSIARFSVP